MSSKFFLIKNNRLASLASVMVLGALVLSACMTASTPAPAPAVTAAPKVNPAPAEQSGASMPAEPTISIATDAKLGKLLVGDNGMTLYIFTKDGPNQSNCGPDCLSSWPPLLTQGSPKLGEGVDASLVGSATLPDGSKIVTYNQMPLYYFVGDTKAGETKGQGAGNVWYVLSPEGKAVDNDKESEAPAPAATTAPGEASLSVATDAKLGKMLVGTNGMTLYAFGKDGPNQVNCNSACLVKWPPLVTQGNPTLGNGVQASLVGTASLPDGSKIVTYNKMPLYFFAKDTKPGDTTGQGVGSVWYVVSPDGKVVDEDASSAAPAPAAAVKPLISVATDAKLGKILVGDNGMTLYMFTNDGPNQSNCDAKCLKFWPPLLATDNPVFGEGVDASLVGTANLPDGSKIVTYNKMPLYYWVKDTKAGDTTGQGVGNVWYVVSPDGKVVDTDVTSAAPAPSVNAAPAPATPEPTINVVSNGKLGKILVGDKGMTLYIFTKDTPDKSNCTGDCLKKWFPLKTLGKPSLGAGIDASLISTASLPDGSMVLTYNKMPLYYFAGDTKAGDTNGEGVGGVWFVITSQGKVVPVPAPIPTPKPKKDNGGGGGMGGGGSHY
jgi:predicted lipoprotein with Yx(FWY)xxD motif